MDPLTQLIELLRPRSFLWKELVGTGSWEWLFPADRGVVFGRVISGRCRFEVPGSGEHEVGPGDYLLLTNPAPWSLRGGAGHALPVDFDTVYAAMNADDPDRTNLASPPMGERAGADVTRIVAGHFEFDPINAWLLASLLSPVVHLPAVRRAEHELLTGVLQMIDAEASSERPGRPAVLSRLLEIMLVELLRTPQLATTRRGMLSGLSDPPIAAALRAFHADIDKPWSVASMAAQAHLSRSAFSGRFTTVVGQPPMTYALTWRMAIARDALVTGHKNVEQVAAATGYGSASAFSIAFSRTVGVSPARYAREALDAE
ncbi:AraC family transcriptional regulator [Leekyejoonella antrihumi]|nr:AraC family transcriptional regulator [Leekyejoonella antrihumi]